MNDEAENDSTHLEFLQLNSNEEIDLSNLNSNLRSLMISGHSIYIVPDIQVLENLTSLWLIGCDIEIADKVSQCLNLEQLYLTNNALSRVPYLDRLTSLKILWLGGNQIESITDCDLPPDLEELNLADNEIKSIMNSFSRTSRLKMLNLAGNPLQSIFEIRGLIKLVTLQELTLWDPMYRPTKIARLQGYRSFVVSTLPQLREIDSFPIEEVEIELTNIFLENKYLYYRMMKNQLFYEYYFQKKQNFHKANTNLNIIKHKMYSFSCNENKCGDTNKTADSVTLHDTLKEEYNEWLKQYNNAQSNIKTHLKIKLSHIDVEQKYFGNIKFETLDLNSEVAVVLKEMLKSSICPYMKKKHNINGLAISMITLVMSSGHALHEEVQMLMDVCAKQTNVGLYISTGHGYIQRSNDMLERFEIYPKSCEEMGEETLTQCFLLAEQPEADLKHSRVASLAYFADTDTAIMQTANHGVTDDNFKCEIRRVINKRESTPYVSMEFHYIFKVKDDISCTKNRPLKLGSGEHHMNPFRSFDYKYWNSLQKLSFTHQSLQKFGVAGQWQNIEELDISYNKFCSLSEICHLFPSLRRLNGSHNNISSLSVMSPLTELKELDLSWNSVLYLIPTLECLSRCAPEIKILSMEANNFMDLQESTHEEFLVLIYLKSLCVYNGYDILEKINTSAERLYVFKTDLEMPDLSEIEIWDDHNSTNNQKENTDMRNDYFNKNNEIKHVSLSDGKQFLDIKFECWTESLTSLKISQNKLVETHFLRTMPNLIDLDLSFNMLTLLDGSLNRLNNLRTLNLSGNYLASLGGARHLKLPSLKILDISNNLFDNLLGVEHLMNIEELYVGYNHIHKVDNYIFIKSFKTLKIIDVRENGISDMEIVRNYLIFHIPNLQYINGTTVSEDEISEANNDFGGVLDNEFLEAQNKIDDIKICHHLSIINSSIKRVSLKEVTFKCLTSINLENNGLETIAEFTTLETLKILCLTGNHISKFGDTTAGNGRFKKLEELHLNSNHIENLEVLEFHRLPLLKKLFLQENEIISLRGIERLTNLEILILDNNKVSEIDSKQLMQLSILKELHIQFNYLSSLDFLQEVSTLEHLHIANNRIKDLKTLRYLKYMVQLENISLAGNPLFKNVDGYVHLLYYLPEVSCIDGVSIEMYRQEDEETPHYE